jgi:hypothetical protein
VRSQQNRSGQKRAASNSAERKFRVEEYTMKYVKPTITATQKATDCIQGAMAKVGVNNDGIQPTSSAYQADE